jgi:hypothetical protein
MCTICIPHRNSFQDSQTEAKEKGGDLPREFLIFSVVLLETLKEK